MVIATTIYSCGPAALATILKGLGIYTTEAELAKQAQDSDFRGRAMRRREDRKQRGRKHEERKARPEQDGLARDVR